MTASCGSITPRKFLHATDRSDMTRFPEGDMTHWNAAREGASDGRLRAQQTGAATRRGSAALALTAGLLEGLGAGERSSDITGALVDAAPDPALRSFWTAPGLELALGTVDKGRLTSFGFSRSTLAPSSVRQGRQR